MGTRRRTNGCDRMRLSSLRNSVTYGTFVYRLHRHFLRRPAWNGVWIWLAYESPWRISLLWYYEVRLGHRMGSGEMVRADQRMGRGDRCRAEKNPKTLYPIASALYGEIINYLFISAAIGCNSDCLNDTHTKIFLLNKLSTPKYPYATTPSQISFPPGALIAAISFPSYLITPNPTSPSHPPRSLRLFYIPQILLILHHRHDQ